MSNQRRVLVVGAGKIGAAIAGLLHHSGDYEVTVADKDGAALQRLRQRVPVAVAELDVADSAAVAAQLQGIERVVSAGPYSVNPAIAEAALHAGASYFDLTEDRATTSTVRRLAAEAGAGQVFMPQCGLAPGFIGILAAELCRRFETLVEVKMRVGALPQYPSNMLLYNLTWSTDGLINEYCNPCEAIVGGALTEVLPLEETELFSLDGVNYEAFNTSGGLGTLCETLEGKVRSLNYKTVRYQGHRYLMKFLTHDLRLGERREMLKDMLEYAVPITLQDVVLIFCTITGWRDGQLIQLSDARKIYDREVHGQHWSAIQLTTAAALCAVLDLHADRLLPQQGFIRQEDVPLPAFLANRFGRFFVTDTHEQTRLAPPPPAYS